MQNVEVNNEKSTINSNEQLQNALRKIEILESDLFKSQTKIKVQETEIKKLQDLVAANNKNQNNTSISFFLPSEFKLNWETFLKDNLMEAFENIYCNQIWLAHIVQDSFKTVYEETQKMVKRKISGVLSFLSINEKNCTSEKFLSRFRSFFQENFLSIFIFDEEFVSEINTKLIECSKEYKDFDMQDDLQQDVKSKSFKELIGLMFKLSIYMILHDPVLVPKITDYKERELDYYFYSKSDFINIEGYGKEQAPCIVILNPPVFQKNKYSYQGIKPAICMAANLTPDILEKCDKNKVIKERSKSQQIQSAQQKFIDDERKDSFIPTKDDYNSENATSSNNLDSKCYNQPLSKKRQREDNLVVTINLSNATNLVTLEADKKTKGNTNAPKKNYRSNSEVVKKEEILNSSEIMMECENSFISENIEDPKISNMVTQKSNRYKDGLQIYRKEEKNKNYPLKVKHPEKKEVQLNLQQQYSSSNKQKFMSHDFLRKKDEVVKIDNNDEILLRKKLVSPDLIKSNVANSSKLNNSNNTNNILRKLGFNSPKLNNYLKLINDSVKKNSIKTVFEQYVKKQKADSKNGREKNLNSSNPPKCNVNQEKPATIQVKPSSSNNRNNASQKCGLSKNLTDQSNKLFIDLTNTELKYNGPKKDDKKSLREELLEFDTNKNSKKQTHSPKSSTLKESVLKPPVVVEPTFKKDKGKLFDHCNSSKPVAFKTLQKTLKNKV